jgi:C1A family cysteine protease
MEYKFGSIQSPADHRDFLYRAIFDTQVLPRKFSRRPEMGPVRNQGSFGSCVAFASAGVKDNQERREYSTNIQTSPLYIYKRCKEQDGIPTQEGTYPRVAMKVLTDLGVCPEEVFPYGLMSWPTMPSAPADADKRAAVYKIGAYARIGTVDEIKQAIYKDGPVMGAVLVCDSFINSTGGFIPIPGSNGADGIRGGHAICVTGYDDDLQYSGHTGYWEFRNSWGDGWGDGGYGYIPYDFVNYRDSIGMPFWQESWSSIDIVLPPVACKEGWLYIGKTDAIIDGFLTQLDQAPTVNPVTCRTLVPMRFMAEHMGYKVDWNGTNQSIHFYK